MTRILSKKLMWNGVIYGMAFATALMIAAVFRPAHELKAPIATASIDHPIAETTPANSVAEVVIP
ncbi:MAG: hypothetical protein OEQ29_00780 [Alphaproteobacteria bacterium]|nr:hypothetical protein [Alphaproteobacteria bacterium]